VMRVFVRHGWVSIAQGVAFRVSGLRTRSLVVQEIEAACVIFSGDPQRRGMTPRGHGRIYCAERAEWNSRLTARQVLPEEGAREEEKAPIPLFKAKGHSSRSIDVPRSAMGIISP
jgi:hypothetical protein